MLPGGPAEKLSNVAGRRCVCGLPRFYEQTTDGSVGVCI